MARCARAASSSGAVMTPQPTIKNAGRGAQNISLTFDLSARTRPREGLRMRRALQRASGGLYSDMRIRGPSATLSLFTVQQYRTD